MSTVQLANLELSYKEIMKRLKGYLAFAITYNYAIIMRSPTGLSGIGQCAKTFINLMTHISKEQTVQYILTMLDDTLQENHQRVSIFFDYAKRSKNSA
ncbi:V-type proton ATPase subunit H [Manis javanica]|nr:V-type proton ATPase subunit H [Manis javanica]